MAKAIKMRMCVACRGRFWQNSLLRLQVSQSFGESSETQNAQDRRIVPFRGFGRSFYLCDSCLRTKNCEKIVGKIFKTNNTKEIAQIWQSKK